MRRGTKRGFFGFIMHPTACMLAAAVLLGACSSEGDKSGPAGDQAAPSTSLETGPSAAPAPSLREYFGALEAGFERLSAAATTAEPGELTDLGALLPFLKESLKEYSAAMNTFGAEVDALNPPPAVAVAHSEFRKALRKDADATAALAQEVSEAETILEATRAIESRPNRLLESRGPCRNLQEIASREGVAVTLPCDE